MFIEDRPRLRVGVVLSLFTEQYFKNVIDKRLSSISLRTRKGRGLASEKLWKFLLVGKNYAQSYRRFVTEYPLLMGRLIYESKSPVIERLFGRGFKVSPELFGLLVLKNRLPLFGESTSDGLDQIAATWDVPALQFNWKGLRMTTISYSLDRCNPYVRRLNVECSTMTLEWMADLLNSLDEVLPSVISVNIRYHHLILPPEQHRLLPCFLREHHSNEKFVEFVSSLKTDQLSMQEFISCFIEFVSGKTRKQAQFVVNIVCPINYCRLTSSTAKSCNVFSCETLNVNLSKK